MYIHKLDEHILYTLIDSKIVVVVSNMSIKNQVTMSIVYIHLFNKLILKTLHHAVNVSTIKAKLFTIRCDINQAVQINDINHIVIIIDSIYIAQRIFNFSVHLYQIQ